MLGLTRWWPHFIRIKYYLPKMHQGTVKPGEGPASAADVEAGEGGTAAVQQGEGPAAGAGAANHAGLQQQAPAGGLQNPAAAPSPQYQGQQQYLTQQLRGTTSPGQPYPQQLTGGSMLSYGSPGMMTASPHQGQGGYPPAGPTHPYPPTPSYQGPPPPARPHPGLHNRPAPLVTPQDLGASMRR